MYNIYMYTTMRKTPEISQKSTWCQSFGEEQWPAMATKSAMKQGCSTGAA